MCEKQKGKEKLTINNQTDVCKTNCSSIWSSACVPSFKLCRVLHFVQRQGPVVIPVLWQRSTAKVPLDQWLRYTTDFAVKRNIVSLDHHTVRWSNSELGHDWKNEFWSSFIIY